MKKLRDYLNLSNYCQIMKSKSKSMIVCDLNIVSYKRVDEKSSMSTLLKYYVPKKKIIKPSEMLVQYI